MTSVSTINPFGGTRVVVSHLKRRQRGALQKLSGLARDWIRSPAVHSNEAFTFQMQDNLLGGFLRRQLACVNRHFGISRLFVRIRDTSEFFQDSGPSFRVKALSIALLANFYRGGEMH